MTKASGPERQDSASDPKMRLERLAKRAALTLIWERAWPPLVSAGAVVALFLGLSWAGLWFVLPTFARLAALAAFAIGAVVALFPLARIKLPSHSEALERLDRDAPIRHRPASGFEDRLANDSDDPETRALWEAHRARLAEEVNRLRVAPPSPRMPWRDPRALRFAALIIAVAGFLAAGPERYARLIAAFDWHGVGAAAVAARVDAWIDPPAYVNKPPMILAVAHQNGRETVTTAEDSVIVLRAESPSFDGAVEGALAPAEPATKPQTGVERRFVVHGDGVFKVTRDNAAIASFAIRSLASAKPTIALVDPPKPNLSGSLALHYRIADAIGVTSAQGAFDAPGGANRHHLVEPPKFALPLPNGAGGVGETRSTVDLSESPWAGAEGELRLSATDAAGKTGESEPQKFTLPQRAFRNPLARALVEQRRKLILDPDDQRGKLAKVLAALTLAPVEFGTPPKVYLGLRAAALRLDRAHDDKALIEVADLLWAMALQIEDGNASQALRDLRALQQKLRDALKNGASDEEIRELTKELRETAERYMQELARNSPPASPEDEPVDSKDVESMLDQLEDSATNGAREDAEAMLDELQDMFENMRGARDAQQSPGAREMRRQMGELDKLLRDQQKLRDDTFRHDQRAHRSRPDAAPDSDDNAEGDQGSLGERQQALKDRLEELKRRMKALGLKPEKGFDDADGEMGEAERDLKGGGQGAEGQQNPGRGSGAGEGDAVEAQGRALEDLRKGAQGLQQQMQASGEGNGNGRGGYRVGRGSGEGQGRDPLGRNPRGDRGTAEGTLNEGPEAAARARRVQQELRRRLGDPQRAEEEKDYFERLLKAD